MSRRASCLVDRTIGMDGLLRHFDVHGLFVQFHFLADSLVKSADCLLAPFACPETPAGAWRLQVRCGPSAAQSLGAPDKPYWSGQTPGGLPAATYSRDGLHWFELIGHACVQMAPAGRAGSVSVAPGSEWAWESGCLTPLLCWMLATVGQHAIHTAALDCAGKATLLAGDSGRGKTTACLALAASGWPLIADDAALVRLEGGRPLLWGLRRPCKVHPNTMQLLPWLARLPRRPCRRSEEVSVEMDSLPSADARAEFPPAAVVLLDERNGVGHRVEPVCPADALAELTRQNVRVLTIAGLQGAKGSFAAMGKLVSSVPCLRLSAGPDPTTLREALEKWVNA